MYSEEKTYIDIQTGEMLSRESKIIKKIKPREFIQVYLEDLAGILSLYSKGEITVMTYIWKYSTYLDEENQPGNLIKIDKLLKDKIKDSIKITDGSIRNIVASFKKKGLLLPHETTSGYYYLNPIYFFKGSLADNVKLYKKTIEYDLSSQE